MAVGAAIAVPTSRLVKMTAIPQLVAIFNGVGGGAAALVSITSSSAHQVTVARSPRRLPLV